MRLDHVAIAGALRRCGRSRAAADSVPLHCHLLKMGLLSHTFLANNLLSMYSDLGLFSHAHNLFDEMPERNVASWTASISIHSSSGHPKKALHTFCSMFSSPSAPSPNAFTFSAAVKAAAVAGEVNLGQNIHAHVLKLGFVPSDKPLVNSLLRLYSFRGFFFDARKLFDEVLEPNTTTYNIMISGYFDGGLVGEAERFFSRILEPDSVTFNAMIAGFARNGSFKALEFLNLMNGAGFLIDEFTFPCVLKVCGGLGVARTGRQIHGCLVKSGIRSSFCGSSLIFMYSACFMIKEAETVFKEFSGLRDFLGIANAMVSGYVMNDQCRLGLGLVSWLHRSGFVVDEHTLSAAAAACAETRDQRSGRQVHAMIVVMGLLADAATATAVVKIYARSGNLEAAMSVFDRLPRRDAITWGALIDSAVDQGSSSLGLTLLKKMMIENCENSALPDEFILSRVIGSCAAATDLAGGRELHGCCIKLGFSEEEVTVTALVDMYSKCGEPEAALAAFRVADCRETASWTAAIGGCAVNGRSTEALCLLKEMVEVGVEANERTFTGALAACRHGGLLQEACEIFGSTAATAEHRHQMADILGRAGLVQEAMEMLEGEGDVTWNVLIGESGKEEGDGSILSTWHNKGDAASAHVSLSNSLARLGQWEDLAKVREASRRRGLRKEPGVSWIEIKT